jgi:hypothetical protein
MRRVLLTFALLLALVPMPSAFFAIGVPQTPVTFSANDPVVSFAGAPSGTVCVLSIQNSKTDTASITGAPAAVTTVFGPADQTSAGLRGYGWCWQGDGADNSFTVTTSGSAAARGFAIELTGTGASDGSSFNDGGASPITLSTDITTTGAGAILLALVHSTSVADFTSDSGNGFTSVAAGDTEIGTVALGQYKVLGAPAAYDAPFTSAAGETTLITAMAISASAAVNPCTRALLGVGCL